MSERKVWVFQATPQRYDLLGALADESLTEDVWIVSRYKYEIHSGHIGLIWMAGKEAGIYARVDVISDPQMMVESEQSARYWRNELDRRRERLRVKILRKSVLINPISKRELQNILETKNMEVIRRPRGTNFKVTNDEWEIISGLRPSDFKE
jgi:hypothetical protein